MRSGCSANAAPSPEFEPSPTANAKRGTSGAKALAARKLSVGFVQKEPPLLVYEMCIGVLNTLNLYRKPCVRQSVCRSYS